jgi:hypothetical protein
MARNPGPPKPQNPDWKRRIEELRPLVPLVRSRLGIGSGLVVSSQGLVVTNRHVVEGAELVELSFFGGESSRGVVVDKCASHDLAIIRTVRPCPTFFNLRERTQCGWEAGDELLAIGHPQGYDFTATRGIVSATTRRFDRADSSKGLIQIDVKIEPGSSGGPSIGASGHLVGINVAGDRHSSHVGFAIPSRVVADYVSAFEKRLESGEASLPTEEDVANWCTEPTPEESVCVAINSLWGDDAALRFTESPIEGYVSKKWSLSVRESDDERLEVDLIYALADKGHGMFRLGYKVGDLSAVQLADPILLGDLLRTNLDIFGMRFALNDDNQLELMKMRPTRDLDPSEVESLFREAIETVQRVSKLISAVREGRSNLRPPQSWIVRQEE